MRKRKKKGFQHKKMGFSTKFTGLEANFLPSLKTAFREKSHEKIVAFQLFTKMAKHWHATIA